MKRILLGFMLIVSLSAHAKDCEEGADNMSVVRQCLFDQSYMPVEATYNALIKSLSANNKAVNEIKKAQDDWLKFVQSSCDHVASTYKGEGYSEDEKTNCLVELNNERVKTLTKYIIDTLDNSCYSLWYQRNLIFAQKGYCFDSNLGKQAFNGFECSTRSPTFSPDEKKSINEIKAKESQLSCNINTALTNDTNSNIANIPDPVLSETKQVEPIEPEPQDATINSVAPQPEVQQATTAPQVAQPSLTIDYGNLTDEQKRKIAETVDYGSLTAQQRNDLADQYIAIGKAQAHAKGEQRMIIFASVVIVVLTLVLIAVVLYFRKKSASKLPLESSLKEPAENQTNEAKSINELDVSESWKKKFEILERAGEFKNGTYENFKSLSFTERLKIGFNFIAFIGQPFYYFFKKMWGKGWVLFGLIVLINAAITVVEIVAKIHISNAVYQSVSPVIFASMANYDFYRFKVHNETMWKPFLKLNKPAAYIGFAVVSLAVLVGVSSIQ